MAARDYPSAVLSIKYGGKAWKRNLDLIPKNVTNIIIDMQVIFIYWWHAQEFIIWIYIYGLRRVAWGLNFFFPRCLFVLYIQKFCYKGCYKFISILCWLFFIYFPYIINLAANAQSPTNFSLCFSLNKYGNKSHLLNFCTTRVKYLLFIMLCMPCDCCCLAFSFS